MRNNFFSDTNNNIITITEDTLRGRSIKQVLKPVPGESQYIIEGLIFSYIQIASKNGSSNPNFLQLINDKGYRLFLTPNLVRQHLLDLTKRYRVTAHVTRQANRADRITKIVRCDLTSQAELSAPQSNPALVVSSRSHDTVSHSDPILTERVKLPKETVDLAREFTKKFRELSLYLGSCNRGFMLIDKQTVLDTLYLNFEELFNLAPNYSEDIEEALDHFDVTREELEAIRVAALTNILAEDVELVSHFINLMRNLSPQSYRQSFEEGVLWLDIIAKVPTTFCNYPCTEDIYLLLTQLSEKLQNSAYFLTPDLFHDIDMLFIAIDKLQANNQCQFHVLNEEKQQHVFHIFEALKVISNQTLDLYTETDEYEYIESIHASFSSHLNSISQRCLFLLESSEVSDLMMDLKPNEAPLQLPRVNAAKQQMLSLLQSVFKVQVGSLEGWDVDAYIALPGGVYPPDAIEGESGLIYGIVFELGEPDPSAFQDLKQEFFKSRLYWVYRCKDSRQLNTDLQAMRMWLQEINDEPVCVEGDASGSSSRAIDEEAPIAQHLVAEAISEKTSGFPVHPDAEITNGGDDSLSVHSAVEAILSPEDSVSTPPDAEKTEVLDAPLSPNAERISAESKEKQAALCMALQQGSTTAKQLVKEARYEEAMAHFSALINQTDAEAEPVLLAMNVMRYLQLKDNILQQPLTQLERKNLLIRAKKVLHMPFESSVCEYDKKIPLAKQIQLALEKINNQLGYVILSALERHDDKHFYQAREGLLSYAYGLLQEKSGKADLIALLSNRLEMHFTEALLYQHFETIYRLLLDNDEPGFYMTPSGKPTLMLQLLALQLQAQIEIRVVSPEGNKTYLLSAEKDITLELVVEYIVSREEFQLLSHRELSMNRLEEQPSLVTLPSPTAALKTKLSPIPPLVKPTNEEKERILATLLGSAADDDEPRKNAFTSILHGFISKLEIQYWNLQSDLTRIKTTIQDVETTLEQFKHENKQKNNRKKDESIKSLTKNIEDQIQHYKTTLDSMHDVIAQHTALKEQQPEVMSTLRRLTDDKLSREKKEIKAIVVKPPQKKNNKKKKPSLDLSTPPVVEPVNTQLEKSEIAQLHSQLFRYNELKNYEKMIETCDIILKSQISIDAYYWRSLAKYRANYFQSALEDIEIALERRFMPEEQNSTFIFASWALKYHIYRSLYLASLTANPAVPETAHYHAMLIPIAQILMDSSTPGYLEKHALFFALGHTFLIEDYATALKFCEDALAETPDDLILIVYKANCLFQLNFKEIKLKEDPKAVQIYQDLLAYITDNLFIKGPDFYLRYNELYKRISLTLPFRAWLQAEWDRYYGNIDAAREQFTAILMNDQQMVWAALALDACVSEDTCAPPESTLSF